MSLITHTSATGYGCDNSTCLAKVQGEPMQVYLAERHYGALAREQGWTFWYKRRQWVYCPEHRPDPSRGLVEIEPPHEPAHAFDESSVLNPATGKPYGPGPLWAGPEPMDYPDPLCVCGAPWDSERDRCQDDPPLQPEPVHVYTSTACQHGLHGRCRLVCKFCEVACGCSCGHPAQPTTSEEE